MKKVDDLVTEIRHIADDKTITFGEERKQFAGLILSIRAEMKEEAAQVAIRSESQCFGEEYGCEMDGDRASHDKRCTAARDEAGNIAIGIRAIEIEK